MPEKVDYLAETIEHIDITARRRPVDRCDAAGCRSRPRPARAPDILDRMLGDEECGVILCLAGSLDQRRPEESVRRRWSDATWSMRSSAPGPTSSTRTSSRPWASAITSPRIGSGRHG